MCHNTPGNMKYDVKKTAGNSRQSGSTSDKTKTRELQGIRQVLGYTMSTRKIQRKYQGYQEITEEITGIPGKYRGNTRKCQG